MSPDLVDPHSLDRIVGRAEALPDPSVDQCVPALVSVDRPAFVSNTTKGISK
jgi:hypothetical protein